MRDILTWLGDGPEPLVYLALGLGAAIENVVPAIPADTFVALGGFLTVVGSLEARWVFVSTWLFNIGGALITYRLGYVHGRPFFERGFGRHLLKAHQMERMAAFYLRWGTPAIFFTRFLPGLRAIVPVFAGVTHQRFLPVAVPLAMASAIWYGGLVWLGVVAGRNRAVLFALLGRVNSVLLVLAVVVVAAVGLWWWRTRHPHDDE